MFYRQSKLVCFCFVFFVLKFLFSLGLVCSPSNFYLFSRHLGGAMMRFVFFFWFDDSSYTCISSDSLVFMM